MNRFFVAIGFLVLCSSAAVSATYYVDASATTGNVTGNGSSGSPWQTITWAMMQVAAGDTVNVAAGTYSTAMSGSSETFPINIPASVHLKSNASPSTLAIVQSGSLAANAWSVSLGNEATIEGFTVTATGATTEAIYAAQSINNVTIKDNTITATGSDARGIRLKQYNTGYVISGNTITGGRSGSTNFGILAGGIASSGAISSNLIRDFTIGARVQATTGHTVTFSNNTLIGNTTGYQTISYSGINNISNCIIAYDPDGSTSTGTGISRNSGTVTAVYSDVYGNATNYSGSITQTGTISANAKFVNSAGNDYHLSGNSPCINTGTMEGTDMGAYAYDYAAPAVYLISPVGGENWKVLTTHNITWRASNEGIAGNITSIDLAYSINGGSSYTNITTESNSGTYAWTIPEIAQSTQAKVRVIAHTASTLGTDESDAVFNINSGNLYVDANTGSNITGNGSLASPWQTITYSMIQAQSGDMVNVAAGIYSTAMAGSSETFPITIPANVYLKSTAGAGTTTIEAGDVETNSAIDISDNSTLEGFTITATTEANYVAAVTAYAGSQIKNNAIISGNSSVCINASGALVSGNTLISNSNSAWGISLLGSDTTLQNNTIEATGTGGIAAYIDVGVGGYLIKNNTLRGTRGAGTSYGFYLDQAWGGTIGTNEVSNFTYGIRADIDPLPAPILYLNNNTFANNTTGCYFSGLGSEFYVTNNIICASAEGGTGSGTGISLWGVLSGYFHNSYNNVYGNATNYSGATSGVGTISAVAKFVDSAGGDYRLLGNSPCIDTGTPEGTDMGAYQYSGTVPAVRIISPAGGESWNALTAHNITYHATFESDPVTTVDLAYSVNGGTDYTNIATGRSNSGTYSWTIPSIVSTTEAKVRVIARSATKAGTDESAAVFTINQETRGPTVEVVIPNGGENWSGGAVHNVTFTITDESEIKANSLRVSYSTDEGTTYVEIASGQPNTSPYSWTVPTFSTNEARVKVEAQDIFNNWGTGESAANFTIQLNGPTMTIQSPNGGEIWNGGANHDISFESSSSYGIKANSLNVYYSVNNGASYTVIATGQSTISAYSWAMPSVNTTEAKVKLEVQDIFDSYGTTESTLKFTIDSTAPVAPTAIFPTTGTTTVDVRPVFSLNASSALSGIASYEVRIDGLTVATQGATTTYTPSTDLTLASHTWDARAKSNAGLWGDFSSMQIFTVEAVPTVEVSITSPSGGDNWQEESTHNITWSTSGDVVSVDLHYSTDNGTTFTSLASGISNTGSYSWILPKADSTQSKIRAAVHSSTKTATAESAAFTISSKSVKLQGQVNPYPTVYKPLTSPTLKLGYQLSTDADVTIYLINKYGKLHWKTSVASGNNGGKAGYNEVDCSGISELSRGYVPNGIYFIKIVSQNRVIATGHLVVQD